jgi:molecular chaperone GrpE
MLNREELFEKFWNYLQAEQTPPEFLGEGVEEASSFDPYQMVAEWIALRHEVKQQGKLMRSAQESLQQALDAARAEKEQLQFRLEESQQQSVAQRSTELAAQKQQSDREQEGLLRELLGVLDALDSACAYWQEELALPTPSRQESKTVWQKLATWFTLLSGGRTNQSGKDASLVPSESSLTEILASNREGVELIRRTLLEVLRRRQIVPIEALGKPFDPKRMYAVGRQASDEAVENTVLQEVVRGYLWGDRILREAQVIVAVKS